MKGKAMTGEEAVRHQLAELRQLMEEVSHSMAPAVATLADEVWEVLEADGRLFFCGNGGSAADAQHLAAEYLVRFAKNRRALPAVALTTDTSVLTAGANDFGFETIFSRQIEGLGKPGDILFIHSTSGESENLIRAAESARLLGVRTVAFLAKGGGRLASLVDRALVVPTRSTARAQEIHLALGHILCGLVEDRYPGEAP